MAGLEAKCGAFFMLSDIKSSSLHDTHKLTTTVLYFEQNHRIDSMHIAVEIQNFEVTAFSSADDKFFSGLWVVVVSNFLK